MARKIVAVEPAHEDRMSFYVFCDDGTVWSWVAPRHRKKLNREDAWEQIEPSLPYANLASKDR